MRRNLSANGIYLLIGTSFFIITACFLTSIFLCSEELGIRSIALLFALLFAILGILLIFLIRKKVVDFSKSINYCIDDIVSEKKEIVFDLESETLIAKLHIKLKRLYDIMQESGNQSRADKQAMQELISDISHQVKTPIANLKMYNTTMMGRQLPPEKEKEFLLIMETQIDKLDFLMQSMIKMSRLETGVIVLNIKLSSLYDTIALALGSIVIPAEKKNIEVTVSCDLSLKVPHDKKWTGEALFNILDNAVKYAGQGSKISIDVAKWEMYTKIDITDTGKGISEHHIAQIFSRFYREDEVHNIEGVGIGLYLCREIISKQGGYIKVKSEVHKGSTFSVFLLN